ncbi:MAG: helix-turn-helix domain-containing protein [Candidatus Liptonbacteria bacterium]|nr:helix-turn-helix domain-containing protein [Candidatus Liptonbacteria bacterium]
MPRDYYSTLQAANILRISRIAVFNKIKSGKLKAQKIGRNYIISHASLMEALGKNVGVEKKAAIDRAIDRAMKDYGETFKLLGRESKGKI